MEGPFIKAYKSVLKIPTKGTRGMIAKWVLLELIDRQQRPSGFPVSCSMIGHEIGGATERTVQRAIKDLLRSQFIKITRRSFVGNTYQVDLNKLEQYDRESYDRESPPIRQRVVKGTTESRTSQNTESEEKTTSVSPNSLKPQPLASIQETDVGPTGGVEEREMRGRERDDVLSRYGKTEDDDRRRTTIVNDDLGYPVVVVDGRQSDGSVNPVEHGGVTTVETTSDGRPMISFDEFKERLGRGESVRLDQVRRTR